MTSFLFRLSTTFKDQSLSWFRLPCLCISLQWLVRYHRNVLLEEVNRNESAEFNFSDLTGTSAALTIPLFTRMWKRDVDSTFFFINSKNKPLSNIYVPCRFPLRTTIALLNKEAKCCPSRSSTTFSFSTSPGAFFSSSANHRELHVDQYVLGTSLPSQK